MKLGQVDLPRGLTDRSAERCSWVAAPPAACGRDAADANEAEQVIASIWRRVLKRQDLSRTDDFFEIGGDSLAAIDIILAIETELGVALPITLIYHAPTIATLTEAARQQARPGPSPLVLLRAGEGGPPLFIVHGVGGNVMELFPLGRAIDYAGPIYGLRSRGLDGLEAPNRSVPAMASDYMAAIRTVQPEGPYRLAGYSFGGLVAFEMAQRLQADGSGVTLLALLDSTTNIRQWPRAVFMRWMSGRILSRARNLPRQKLRDWPEYLRLSSQFVRSRLQWRLGSDPVQPQPDGPGGIVEAIGRINLVAASAYRPTPYTGCVTLINSELGNPYTCDPRWIWRHYAPSMRVHVVPGTHTGMIAGHHLDRVAAVLTTCLNGPYAS